MNTSEIKTNKPSFREDGFNIAKGNFKFEYTVPIFVEECDRERAIRLKINNSRLSYQDKSLSSPFRFILINSYYDSIANTLTPFAVTDATHSTSRIYTDDNEVAQVQEICDKAVDLLDIAEAYREFSENREPSRNLNRTLRDML